jgi:hypothetical protein
MDDLLSYFERPEKYDEQYADQMRKKHLSTSLNSTQKMELYNAAVAGSADKLKTLIEEKKYPLMEECSAAGYFWTAMHYAAHYGFDTIVEFYLQYYKNHPQKIEILNLQSNLGLSPLLIAINGGLDIEKKKTVINLYLSSDCIDFKICSKENQDVFSLCKKHGLLEYFLSMLRED